LDYIRSGAEGGGESCRTVAALILGRGWLALLNDAHSLPRWAWADVASTLALPVLAAAWGTDASNSASTVASRKRRTSSAESTCMGCHGGVRSAVSNSSIPPPISMV